MSSSPLDQPLAESLDDNQPHALALEGALFRAIWELEIPARTTISPLTKFYLATISIVDQHDLIIKEHRDVVNIVNFVRQRKNKKRSEIAQDITTTQPRWLGSTNTSASHDAINLAIRLWLLVDPASVQEDDTNIIDQVAQTFPQATSSVDLKNFEPHFDAEFLKKVAGITILGTSSLTEHLTYDKRRKVLMLFDLADFLNGSRSSEEE